LIKIDEEEGSLPIAALTINDIAYNHDPIGNRLTRKDPDKEFTYSYDTTNRLLKSLPAITNPNCNVDAVKEETFIYDPVGNRLTGPRGSKPYTYDNANELMNYRRRAYEYDNNGNLTKKIRSLADGTIKTWSYTYDYEDKLCYLFFHTLNDGGKYLPRQARLDAPGTLHHVIIRGIEKRRIVDDNEDQANFISRMGEIAKDTGTTIYAWALVANHAHILLRSSSFGLPRYMRRLLTGYAISYNKRHRRHGHLFRIDINPLSVKRRHIFLS